MSATERTAQRTDWKRIGLIATILLVPGGFVLGGVLAARRLRAAAEASDDVKTEDAPDPHD